MGFPSASAHLSLLAHLIQTIQYRGRFPEHLPTARGLSLQEPRLA